MSIGEIYNKLSAAADNYDNDAVGALNELKAHLEQVPDMITAITGHIEDGDKGVAQANDGASAALTELVERASKVSEAAEEIGRAVAAAVNELDEAITDLTDVATAVRDWQFGA